MSDIEKVVWGVKLCGHNFDRRSRSKSHCTRLNQTALRAHPLEPGHKVKTALACPRQRTSGLPRVNAGPFHKGGDATGPIDSTARHRGHRVEQRAPTHGPNGGVADSLARPRRRSGARGMRMGLLRKSGPEMLAASISLDGH
jgi:hypothetical protein